MSAEIVPFRIERRDDFLNRPGRRVYILACEGLSQVKIGVANNVRSRLVAHQCSSPFALKVIRTLAGGQNIERAFHKYFSALRLTGEWFEFSPEMMTFFPEGYDHSVRTTERHDQESANKCGAWLVMRMCGLADLADPFDRDTVDRNCAENIDRLPDLNAIEKQNLILDSIGHLLNKAIDRVREIQPGTSQEDAVDRLILCLEDIADDQGRHTNPCVQFDAKECSNVTH